MTSSDAPFSIGARARHEQAGPTALYDRKRSSAAVPPRPRSEAVRHLAHGFTLLEIIVVLGIIGLVAGLLGPRILSAMSGAKRSEITQEFYWVAQAVRDTRSIAADYGTGDITGVVINGGGLPSNMVRSGAVQNLYNGAVTVTGQTQTALITFNGLPRDGCQKLSTSISDSSAGGPSALAINGTAQSLTLSAAAAQTACSQTGSGAGAGNSVAVTIN